MATTKKPLNPFPRHTKRSEERVRALDRSNLGLVSQIPVEIESKQGMLTATINADDPVLLQVKMLLNDGYAGVILSGQPGTSKSWYAAQIAAVLAENDPDRVRFIQFHPSYQYEDFVEGYVPNSTGTGFVLTRKHLLEMCEVASKHPGKTCVLVIDELSRGDPGRIFGEALTYIEMTKRGISFKLASGTFTSIPENLVFLATMNPMDRGVDEVDAAFERRFAKIAMDPSVTILKKFLDDNGVEELLKQEVIRFFEFLTKQDNSYCQIGHAYFYNIRDREGLERLWNHQLRFHMERAFKLDSEGLRKVKVAWERVMTVTKTSISSASDPST